MLNRQAEPDEPTQREAFARQMGGVDKARRQHDPLAEASNLSEQCIHRVPEYSRALYQIGSAEKIMSVR